MDTTEITEYSEETPRRTAFDIEWDNSEADVKNVMRTEYPEHVNKVRKCLRVMGINKVTRDDSVTVARYAVRYGISIEKLMLIM